GRAAGQGGELRTDRRAGRLPAPLPLCRQGAAGPAAGLHPALASHPPRLGRAGLCTGIGGLSRAARAPGSGRRDGARTARGYGPVSLGALTSTPWAEPSIFLLHSPASIQHAYNKRNTMPLLPPS